MLGDIDVLRLAGWVFGLILLVGSLAMVWAAGPHVVRALARGRDGDPADRRRHRLDLIAVGVVASAVAAAQLVWIWQHRRFGTLDGDEARYVAGALHYQRILTGGYAGNLYLFFGPVVPLLSGIAMIVGPLDPRTAMSVQPLLVVGLAVAATGVAHRVTDRRSAVFAGCAACLLPATIAASQTYLLVIGSAFALTAAAWALFASDRGNNWQVWAVGVFLAMAPLSRGMTLAMLPAAFGASLLMCSTSPRGLRRMIASLSASAVVTSLFFLTEGAPIMNYIAGGLEVPENQSPDLLERLGYRWREVSEGFGRPLLFVAVGLAAAGFVVGRRRGERLWSPRGNPSAALAIVVVGGGVVLLAGGYIGGYGFWDYPLMPLLVVLLVSYATKLPRPVTAVVGTLSLAWLVYLAAYALWLIPVGAPGAEVALGRYSRPLFETQAGADPRFTADRRPEQRQAAREWWEATVEIDDRLRDIDEESLKDFEVVHLGGVNYLYYASQIVAVLGGRDPVAFRDPIPSPGGDWSGALEPTDDTTERVLLIPEIADPARDESAGRSAAEYDLARMDSRYRDSVALRSAAEAAGWRVVDRIALPLGDRMLVLRSPDAE